MNLHTYPTHTPIHPHSYPISYYFRDDDVGVRVESSSRPVSRKFAESKQPTWGRRRQNPALRSSVHHPSSSNARFSCFSLLFFKLSSPPHFSFALSPCFPQIFHPCFFLSLLSLRGSFPAVRIETPSIDSGPRRANVCCSCSYVNQINFSVPPHCPRFFIYVIFILMVRGGG